MGRSLQFTTSVINFSKRFRNKSSFIQQKAQCCFSFKIFPALIPSKWLKQVENQIFLFNKKLLNRSFWNIWAVFDVIISFLSHYESLMTLFWVIFVSFMPLLLVIYDVIQLYCQNLWRKNAVKNKWYLGKRFEKWDCKRRSRLGWGLSWGSTASSRVARQYRAPFFPSYSCILSIYCTEPIGKWKLLFMFRSLF